MGNKIKPEFHEQIKQQIINKARDIISKEGISGLTIRKITNAIGYSPGIVYHYFLDKDEIVNHIFNMGYQQILSSVKDAINTDGAADEVLKRAMTAYVHSVILYSTEYKAIMTSDDSEIKKKTKILEKNSIDTNPALGMLKDNLERGIKEGIYRQIDTYLSAQVIWTSLFGFSLKVSNEEIDEVQLNKLMEKYFDIIFMGLTK